MVISKKKFNVGFFVLVSVFSIFILKIFNISERNSNFSTLLPCEKIQCAQGFICSNPSLTSSKKFYKCAFLLENVTDKNEKAFYEAKGQIFVLIPRKIVEAHYPKKLYSVQSSDVIVENGANIKFSVNVLNEDEKLFIADNAQFLGWKNKISYFRGNARLNFKRLLSTWGSAGGFLLALLSGSREYTEDSISQFFALAGLSHVLALSGMHVSIFSCTTEKLFKNICGKKVTSVISLCSVILFVWFAGLSPSLSRALISSLLIFFTSFFCIKTDSLNLLALTFLIQIMIFPADFFSVSFILSYLSLCGILCLSKFFSYHFARFSGRTIGSSLASSTSAILFTSPVCVKIFGYICPIGIISTMIISPLVTWFLIIGIFCVIFSLIFPAISSPLGTILQILYYVIKCVSGFFAKFPPIYFS